jgi:hypothetical protein
MLATTSGSFAKTFLNAPFRRDAAAVDELCTSTEVNTGFNDGCPILSPYDGSLYMASNRARQAGRPRHLKGWSR